MWTLTVLAVLELTVVGSGFFGDKPKVIESSFLELPRRKCYKEVANMLRGCYKEAGPV